MLSKAIRKLSPPLTVSFSKAVAIIDEAIANLDVLLYSVSDHYILTLFKFIEQHWDTLDAQQYNVSSVISSLMFLVDSSPILLSHLLRLDVLCKDPVLPVTYVRYILSTVLSYSFGSTEAIKTVAKWCVKHSKLDLLQEVMDMTCRSVLTNPEKHELIKSIINLQDSSNLIRIKSLQDSHIIEIAEELVSIIDSLETESLENLHIFVNKLRELPLLTKYSIVLKLSRRYIGLIDLSINDTQPSSLLDGFFGTVGLSCDIGKEYLTEADVSSLTNGVFLLASQTVTFFSNSKVSHTSSHLWIFRCKFSSFNYTRSSSKKDVKIDDQTLALLRSSVNEVELPSYELTCYVLEKELQVSNIDHQRLVKVLDQIISQWISHYQELVVASSLDRYYTEICATIKSFVNLYSKLDLSTFAISKKIDLLHSQSLLQYCLSLTELLAENYEASKKYSKAADTILAGIYRVSSNNETINVDLLQEIELAKQRLIELYTKIRQVEGKKHIDFDNDYNAYESKQKAPEPAKKKKPERYIPERPPQHIDTFSVDDSLFSALLDGVSESTTAVVEEEHQEESQPTEESEVLRLYTALRKFLSLPGGEHQLFTLHNEQLQLESSLIQDLDNLLKKTHLELVNLKSFQCKAESKANIQERQKLKTKHSKELSLLKTRHLGELKGKLALIYEKSSQLRNKQQTFLSARIPEFVVSSDSSVLKIQASALKMLVVEAEKQRKSTATHPTQQIRSFSYY
ncbi:hypothetical protein P9112_003106 [Eukaryota sp. TZLM1-RC]